MGCDIHAHAEVKKDGKWIHYDKVKINRNYELFERMAGVRGDDARAISPPRGLPDDVTESTKLCSDLDGIDGHSHSWLSLEEVVSIETDFNHPFEFLFGNYWSAFSDDGDDARVKSFGVTDARLVFWFDN